MLVASNKQRARARLAHVGGVCLRRECLRSGVSRHHGAKHRNEKRFGGGLVFKAHRWLYHSTLGSRVIKKKKDGGALCPRLEAEMAVADVGRDARALPQHLHPRPRI